MHLSCLCTGSMTYRYIARPRFTISVLCLCTPVAPVAHPPPLRVPSANNFVKKPCNCDPTLSKVIAH